MEEKVNKFHALQLFTDTFAAETVHLTNEQVGIYIRLLCFAWTKNAKMFTNDSAYRICQCIDDKCKRKVDGVLIEFFKKNGISGNTTYWLHKRLTAEHEYLTAKYQKRSEAGKKGGLAKSKNQAPIPIPKPIPNKNIYNQDFEDLWSSLNIKKGSKFTAYKIFQKITQEIKGLDIAEIYNNQQSEVDDKFVPHFSTWLSQKRWEMQPNDQKKASNGASLITKMQKVGYVFRHQEDNFLFFKKDGKEFKVDRYDKDHIIQPL
jgi:uncharacterized protein YdaU (DUF1376 family)